MTAFLSSFRRHLSISDLVLFVAALVSGLLYLALLPARHPDSAASYSLGEEQALQAAEAFLAARGHAVDGLEASASLRRQQDVLNRLQETLGASETVALLRGEAGQHRLPAYYWDVTYRPEPTEEETSSPPESPYRLSLTLDGGIWSFERDMEWLGTGPPVNRGSRPQFEFAKTVDRNALRALFTVPEGASSLAPPPDIGSLSDSLLTTALVFDDADSLWGGQPDSLALWASASIPLDALGADVPAGAQVRLGPGAAIALARYHLGQMVWEADRFQADSVWLPPARNAQLARVRFVRTEALYEQQVQVEMAVSVTGVLQEADVSFNPDEQDSDGISLRTIASILEVALYVVIVLVLLIAFIKRFSARLIDGKAALVDGLVLGLLMIVMLGLMKQLEISDFDGPQWLTWLIKLVVVGVVGTATAIFTMAVAGTTDSLARAEWPTKLRTASLVRLGAFRNVYIGRAFLRGVGIGFILLGVLIAFLAVAPGAAVYFKESRQFMDEVMYQPMAGVAAGNGLGAYFVLLYVLLGVGTFVYHLWKKAWLVVAAVALMMALMQGSFISLQPVAYNWLLSGLWGGVLGYTFWRYDFLTSFIALFVALMVWSVSEGWLVTASPVWIDVMLTVLLLGGLVLLGLIGVASGRTKRDVVEYVPDYIEELTQKERLRSELEIARHVQETFLPRRMPQVDGLDIAGMCLAALEIGGDYFDFVKQGSDKLAVVVGDVSGKGTEAAFYMTLTKGFVQTLSRESLSPAQVMRRLNTLFMENVPRGIFISMIYGVFDVEARTFTFARAGHNPVILKRSPSQEADLMQPAGLAIGLAAGPLFDDSIEEVTLDLRHGDVLVFYTDGFSEAMNRTRELYGDDRLAHKVSDVGQRSANEILRAVSEDVHHFVEAQGRHDDMTMVVVKQVRRVQPTATPSGQAEVAAER